MNRLKEIGTIIEIETVGFVARAVRTSAYIGEVMGEGQKLVTIRF